VTGSRKPGLDALDRRLLAALQIDAMQPMKGLAAELGISESSVQRRIRRLRAAGVIRATVAVVDPAAVGRPLLLVVDVTLDREDVANVEAFKRLVRSIPEIVTCYHLTGDHTFMLTVCLADMNEYAGFAARVFDANRAVAKFRTSAVMSRVKDRAAIPVGAPEAR